MKSCTKMYNHIAIASIVVDIREECKLKANYVRNATFVIRRNNYYIIFFL